MKHGGIRRDYKSKEFLGNLAHAHAVCTRLSFPPPHEANHRAYFLHNLVQLSLHIITLAEADPGASHNISYIKAKSKANNTLSKMVKDDLLETLQGCDIAHGNRVQNVSFAFSLALGIDDLDSQINAGTLGDRHMTPL